MMDTESVSNTYLFQNEKLDKIQHVCRSNVYLCYAE
jgi:hypothetical protein